MCTSASIFWRLRRFETLLFCNPNRKQDSLICAAFVRSRGPDFCGGSLHSSRIIPLADGLSAGRPSAAVGATFPNGRGKTLAFVRPPRGQRGLQRRSVGGRGCGSVRRTQILSPRGWNRRFYPISLQRNLLCRREEVWFQVKSQQTVLFCVKHFACLSTESFFLHVLNFAKIC